MLDSATSNSDSNGYYEILVQTNGFQTWSKYHVPKKDGEIDPYKTIDECLKDTIRPELFPLKYILITSRLERTVR